MGFPGETEDDFEALLEFLGEASLDRVGCFAYSPVAGAAANDLDGAVSEAEKQARVEAFMTYQAEISAARLQAKVGKRLTVLVDECHPEAIIARSTADAPEIDGTVVLNPDDSIEVGDFVECLITASDEYDLYGEALT